jgi:hypothetical protein
MKSLFACLLLLMASLVARGAVVWSQLPANPPAGAIPSQLWYDPTSQNNLDSDAIAYDDFTLSKATAITHIEWWGESGPSVGFFISFYRQDPNTTAFQPDLIQITGNPPLASGTYTNFTQTAAGNGMYHFTLDLTNPISLAATNSANPRYFIAIVDSMPTAFKPWGWAQGFGPNSKTFYWQYAGSPAGGPYYSTPPSDRAFVLSDASVPPPSLTARHTLTNSVVLSWPTNADGFTLQQNADLTASNWTNTTDNVTVADTNNTVLLLSPAGNRFFRLSHP